MESKNIRNKIKSSSGILSGVIAVGLAIGGFIYTPKQSNEFLEERYKIDLIYNTKQDSLFNSYMFQKDCLKKDYLNQLKDLKKNSNN